MSTVGNNTQEPVRKSLQVTSEVYKLLREDFEKSDKTMSFTQYASYKLGLMFNKEKWVQEMYPTLKFVAIDGDAVIIRDSDPQHEGLFEVKMFEEKTPTITRKHFECDRCDPPTDCSHVMMAQAIKVTSKL